MLCLIVGVALVDQAFAQQPPQQPPDPDLVILKLDGCTSLLNAREKQIVDMNRVIQNERAYWAAYVAGLSAPPLAQKTP